MLIFKLFPALLCWIIFVYVIFQLPYPDSLTSASTFQIFSFFTSLFLSLSFSINIFINFMLRSIIISFGLILLLVLKALNSLNLVSCALTIIAFGLLISYVKKPKYKLTYHTKTSRLKNLRRQKY